MGLRVGMAAALASWLSVASAWAYPDGPPPGHTGGFGEPTCAACHFGGEAPPGGLALEGLEGAVTPGADHELVLRLDPAGMPVGGVQLSVRHADGPKEGRSAGRLSPADQTLEAVEQDGVTYLGHRGPARPGDDGDIVWRLRWSAPEEGSGSVILHGTAVAGDDDESPLGDLVHELERRLTP